MCSVVFTYRPPSFMVSSRPFFPLPPLDLVDDHRGLGKLPRLLTRRGFQAFHIREFSISPLMEKPEGRGVRPHQGEESSRFPFQNSIPFSPVYIGFPLFFPLRKELFDGSLLGSAAGPPPCL